jgi:hypothetical protein
VNIGGWLLKVRILAGETFAVPMHRHSKRAAARTVSRTGVLKSSRVAGKCRVVS